MSDSEDEKKDAPEEAPEGEAEEAAAAEPTPEERIAALEKEKGEIRERMLRIAAEYENFKKRSRKDMSDAAFKAKEAVLKDMLEGIDNLERALTSSANAKETKPILDGVNLVLRSFNQKLERHNVKAIEARGKPFDPHVHEAVSRQETTEVQAGAVLEELVKGYTLGERLLRAATVVVAVAPADAQPAEPKADEASAPESPASEGDTEAMIAEAAAAVEAQARREGAGQEIDLDDGDGEDEE